MTPEDINFITNVLRRGTIKWRGRSDCLKKARKSVLIGKHKNGNPHYKLYWQCAECKEWYDKVTLLEVDHIIEIGPFDGSWDSYVNKVYCGQDNLRALCLVCHSKKTSFFNASLRFQRRLKSSGD